MVVFPIFKYTTRVTIESKQGYLKDLCEIISLKCRKYWSSVLWMIVHRRRLEYFPMKLY